MAYLHHQQDCVQDNKGHDEILERRRLDNPPKPVLEADPLLRHVPLQGSGIDGKVDAGFLKRGN